MEVSNKDIKITEKSHSRSKMSGINYSSLTPRASIREDRDSKQSRFV